MTSRLLLVSAVLFFFARPGLAAPTQDADEDAADLPEWAVPAASPVGVRRITDGALTCEQLYAESRALEQAIAKHRGAAEAAQREAVAAQQALMKQAAGGSALPMASSLLGMVPGGGMVSGLAAQAALASQRAAMEEGAERTTSAYQRLAQAQEQAAHAQARNDHVVGLFLQKKCAVPAAEATR